MGERELATRMVMKPAAAVSQEAINPRIEDADEALEQRLHAVIDEEERQQFGEPAKDRGVDVAGEPERRLF